jgi:hypothetical protein
MWQSIVGFFGGPIATIIVNGILSGYKARLDASNTTGAQAADVAKVALEAEVKARAEANKVVIAEEGRWYTALPRVAVQAAAAAFFCKAVIWDSMLGWGTTPDLVGTTAITYNLIMGAWFGAYGGAKIIGAVRTWWR